MVLISVSYREWIWSTHAFAEQNWCALQSRNLQEKRLIYSELSIWYVVPCHLVISNTTVAAVAVTTISTTTANATTANATTATATMDTAAIAATDAAATTVTTMWDANEIPAIRTKLIIRTGCHQRGIFDPCKDYGIQIDMELVSNGLLVLMKGVAYHGRKYSIESIYELHIRGCIKEYVNCDVHNRSASYFLPN